MSEADPLAVYIHWPFCVSKCPYCDFNSHVRAEIDEAAWQGALLADLAFEATLTPGRTVGSIFFGGGTPSLMAPATVAAVIAAVARHWRLADGIEITLEANPSSVEAARFAGFAAAGVNRVSLGLQALEDDDLRALGRPHDVRQGLAALDVAQATFPRVSLDLIYQRPGQTLASWEAELARALAFGTEHLSLYGLTIEPGTRFATLHARGELVVPGEDAAADLFELTAAMTAAAGRPTYEVSNHARTGAESRHNLSYWTYGDYVGVGPGAHGRRAGEATVRHKKPENWLSGRRRARPRPRRDRAARPCDARARGADDGAAAGGRDRCGDLRDADRHDARGGDRSGAAGAARRPRLRRRGRRGTAPDPARAAAAQRGPGGAGLMFAAIRPLLFRLDPERAHDLTLRALEAGLGPRGRADDPVLATRLAGLDLPNPVGLAAGFDKDARVPGAMLRLGFGFVEVGTVTPKPQAGNPRPRVFRFVAEAAVINRLGFNNGGVVAALARLRADRPAGIVGVNIGANKDAQDRVADYAFGAAAAAPIADYLTVNISSPNTPGLRGLQDPGELTALIAAVLAGAGTTPVFVKVAPDLDVAAIDGIARVAMDSGIAGLIVSNTTLARPGVSSAEAGGLSGAPLFAPSTAVLRAFARATAGRLPLIGVGGVASGAQAYAKLRAGASAVQLYTGLVFHGPALVGRIKRELAAALRRDGLASVGKAVGLDA